MDDYHYFNHTPHSGRSWWDRRQFLNSWRRLYGDDPYWVPPYFPVLRKCLVPSQSPHLARLSPIFTYLEALPRRGSKQHAVNPHSIAAAFDLPVATALVLRDPRRRDGAAYLSLLHSVYDRSSLKKLLTLLTEILAGQGCRKVIGPVGPSPYLGSGVLQDYWDRLPPLHTPYHPPYFPELISHVLRPRWRSQLYHLAVPEKLPNSSASPARLVPFDPARLAADLLPLFVAACPPWADTPPLDAEEAAVVLHKLQPWPLHGWLSEIEGQAVGFVLLQPDMAPALQQANGGRTFPAWLWLMATRHRPVKQGRILFGSVLPAWRGQGIGQQLLGQALTFARHMGWQKLTIGPVPSTGPANKFLKRHGAEPQQTYLLYQQEL
ncbi:MAG: GNAT family N-acetyltransferase [Anaerolineae bacterium]|nr:GNAT family N-acetyltransferase [Anaerolineae bacterium]